MSWKEFLVKMLFASLPFIFVSIPEIDKYDMSHHGIINYLCGMIAMTIWFFPINEKQNDK